MSYREENGQVVLTMSREDWCSLLLTLGYAMGCAENEGRDTKLPALLNRLNEGNPNYRPYEVAEES